MERQPSIPPSSPSQTLMVACFSCLQWLKLKQLCTFLVQPSVSHVSNLIEDVILKGHPDHPQRRIRQLTLTCLPLWACLTHSLCLHVVSLHLMSKSYTRPYGWGLQCCVTCLLKASDTLLSDFELLWTQEHFVRAYSLTSDGCCYIVIRQSDFNCDLGYDTDSLKVLGFVFVSLFTAAELVPVIMFCSTREMLRPCQTAWRGVLSSTEEESWNGGKPRGRKGPGRQWMTSRCREARIKKQN